jgi:copper chaperone CopZ
VTALATPRVVHALPGRLRVHVPEWARAAPGRLERQLSSLPGVERALASPDTGNVLIRFDPAVLDRERILAAIAELGPPATREDAGQRHDEHAHEEEPAPLPPAVLRPHAGPNGRARITVTGLDRDPQLARRVEERLEARPEIERAEASPITGRVLVVFSRRFTDLDDLLNEVAKLQLAPRP